MAVPDTEVQQPVSVLGNLGLPFGALALVYLGIIRANIEGVGCQKGEAASPGARIDLSCGIRLLLLLNILGYSP